MNIIKRSEDFDEWLKKLRDTKGKIKILSRIDNARRDNFGDAKALGGAPRRGIRLKLIGDH